MKLMDMPQTIVFTWLFVVVAMVVLAALFALDGKGVANRDSLDMGQGGEVDTRTTLDRWVDRNV